MHKNSIVIVSTYSMVNAELGGKTILTVIGAPVSPTEGEMQTYEESQEMVQEGFSGTFVQLADYLSTISYD
ncbi:hypothetical protein GCM10009597_21290 [Peribacillus frigoritolerans]